jgi:predicted membrane-bound mannosyltransferase
MVLLMKASKTIKFLIIAALFGFFAIYYPTTTPNEQPVFMFAFGFGLAVVFCLLVQIV